MKTSTQPSKDSPGASPTWHTVRFSCWRISLLIFLCSLPGYIVNILVASIDGFRRGQYQNSWFMVGACVVFAVMIPLMAMLIRHTIYLQVSTAGLRDVNACFGRTFSWDEIERVKRFGPVYFLRGLYWIVVTPWLMESYAEFQLLVEEYAPPGHAFVELVCGDNK